MAYMSVLRLVLRHCTRLGERSHGAQGGSEGRAAPAPWRSVIAGAEVGRPRDGRAVGGAPMGERVRAGFRRDSDLVQTTKPRNGGAGCDRIAQAALCGAVGLVALVQPSGRATRTDRGVGARLDVFGERRARRAGCSDTRFSGGR